MEIENLDEYTAATKEGNVLVKLGAAWCGPCNQIDKILPRLEEKIPNWKVVKVDIDKVPEVKDLYAVRSVPQFLFFKDGQLKQQFAGVKPLTELEKMVKALDEN